MHLYVLLYENHNVYTHYIPLSSCLVDNCLAFIVKINRLAGSERMSEGHGDLSSFQGRLRGGRDR